MSDYFLPAGGQDGLPDDNPVTDARRRTDGQYHDDARYRNPAPLPAVIKEMSEVVRLGGFGSSVTPVSQFYFQQAYLNVTQGKWKKINPSYGNMVLGYFR